jgi:hypothetical protein
MKKSLLLILLIAGFANAQETEFKFTKDGFTDFVVINIEGKNQQELYEKALDWLQVTYKNPKEVIKAQIENDYVRIEGFESEMLCTSVLGSVYCQDVKYQVEISFKDGRYKFDVVKVESYEAGTIDNNLVSKWIDFPINSAYVYFKKDGSPKGMFKLYPEAFENTFNNLKSSLKDFLSSETIPSKTEEW